MHFEDPLNMVDPWYPLVCGSKETSVEKKTPNAHGAFSTVKVHKFTCTVCTVVLSIHNLKLHGIGYVTVTKITFFMCALIQLTKN
jgi:hypothetical protein